MTQLTCKHCEGKIEAQHTSCPNCGIPLPPNHAKTSQKNFIWFFIGIVILCIFMIIWLPPNWLRFLGK